jgi:hypothetical protein
MEAEVRSILSEAVEDRDPPEPNLAEAIRRRFGPLGGVDLELPPREYVDAPPSFSKGISVRVMKGVYYHVGGFKGHAIDRTERVDVDRGWLTVTNKHIHFTGDIKALRIQYRKIASFLPFSNGVGIIRDSTTAKPQLFITHDGWFTCNLVANLARL